jgi:hypothetical protein
MSGLGQFIKNLVKSFFITSNSLALDAAGNPVVVWSKALDRPGMGGARDCPVALEPSTSARVPPLEYPRPSHQFRFRVPCAKMNHLENMICLSPVRVEV